MRLEGFKVNIGLFNLLLLVAILSCMDDTFTNNTTAKGTFISIRGIGVQSSTHLVNPETYDFVFFSFTLPRGGIFIRRGLAFIARWTVLSYFESEHGDSQEQPYL